MLPDVRQRLELGNQYARNNQWNNAITVFDQALTLALSSCGDGQLLEPVPGLLAALKTLHGKPMRVDGADEALKKLREAHEKTHGADLGGAPWIGAFENPFTGHWSVVYHDQEQLRYGDLTIPIPIGSPRSFVVKFDGNETRSVALSQAVAAQLSYIISHLAWARVTVMMRLYRQHRILPDSAIHGIMAQVTYYEFALQLNPPNAWVLSHIAEMYRDIANGWPGSIEELKTPKTRVENYVKAIVYYGRAIELKPESFWAHAHLGAAIVNIRAFYGITQTRDESALSALSKAWFPYVDPKAWTKEWLTKAKDSLLTAQRLRGNFYPWAQLYYADVLALKALQTTDESNANNLELWSLIYTVSGISLQPQLATELFEPSELYGNPFFQFGLAAKHGNRLDLAWEYTYIGMSRAFNFQFIPGLQSLLGYQLLAAISLDHITSQAGAAHKEYRLSTGLDGDGDIHQAPVPIPRTPIGSRCALVEFIRNVFEKCCVPAVDPFLESEIVLNTPIAMSLAQVFFILQHFRKILGYWCDNSTEELRVLSEYMGRIRNKSKESLSFSLPDPQSPNLAEYDHEIGDMAAHIHVGKPSYHMADMLSRQ